MPKKPESPRIRLQRKINLAHRFDARDIFEALAIMSKGKCSLEPASTDRLAPYIDKVFARLKLDGTEERHWMYATALLAFAVYFRKPSGRALVWTKKKVKELKRDLDALKVRHPNLTELELCVRLLKAHPHKYEGKPETLRRRLHPSKAKNPKKRRSSKKRNDWDLKGESQW